MNSFKTAMLFIMLTLMLILLGYFLGGKQGVTIAFGIAMVMNLGSYWFSDKIVLKIYKAKIIDEADNPRLYKIVRLATQVAGLPMPKVYIVPSQSPNAFATGRNPEHAAVAATEGILELLNDDELTGVMAHELGHVKNRDTLVAAVAATIAGAISYIGFMIRWLPFFGDDDDSPLGFVGIILIGILAPIAAMLIQMAISRQREYLADRASAEMSHKSLALASALNKIHTYSRKIPLKSNPASAHMFIINPLTKGSFISLFSTHPSVESRVEKLQEYSREGL